MNAYEQILGYAYDRHPLGKVDSVTKDGDTVRLNVIYKDASIANNIVSRTFRDPIPAIKRVIFNPPATIVMWDDDTKTVVKADKENFDPEKGLAMAISKKALGNKGNYFEEFKKWTEEYDAPNAYNLGLNGLSDGLDKAVESTKNLANVVALANSRACNTIAYKELRAAMDNPRATKKELLAAMEEACRTLRRGFSV